MMHPPRITPITRCRRWSRSVGTSRKRHGRNVSQHRSSTRSQYVSLSLFSAVRVCVDRGIALEHQRPFVAVPLHRSLRVIRKQRAQAFGGLGPRRANLGSWSFRQTHKETHLLPKQRPVLSAAEGVASAALVSRSNHHSMYRGCLSWGPWLHDVTLTGVLVCTA